MGESVVSVTAVSKQYVRVRRRPGVAGAMGDIFAPRVERIQALANIDLQVSAGHCLGLLGPNGAGKSTLIKLIAGILVPDAGAIRIQGLLPATDRHAYLRKIGVVFGQRSRLIWDLPVRDVLELFRMLYRVDPESYRARVERLVNCFDLADLIDVPVRQLSLGQKMRCEIAAVLVPGPSVLLLDEPTVGLDLRARMPCGPCSQSSSVQLMSPCSFHPMSFTT